MNNSFIKKAGALIFSAAAFMILACIPLSGTGTIQKAEAQGILVYDVKSDLINTLAQLSAAALEQKELVWDALFYEIAQKALQQMTNDIITWINSGFDGDPAFVTDLLGYLGEVADDVAGEFIYGDELSTLCTPFQLDVRIALAKKYQKEAHGGFKEEAECSIDDLGDDEAFLSGDFNAGGWAMWFEVVLNPHNTPIGGLVAGDAVLKKKIALKQAEEVKKLEFGNGFFSKEVCTDGKCTITTPGIVFQGLLEKAMNAPMDALLNADEMNEVLGALFGNLAQQAITGVNGLLGLGGNAEFTENSFGLTANLSYLDAMKEESAQNSSSGLTGSRIQQALATETEVLELEVAIVTELDAISTLFTDAQEPFEGDSCWDLDFPAKFTTKVNQLVAQVPETISTVITLEELSEQYEAASSAQQQVQILTRFTNLQSQGLISGQTAVIEYEYYLNSQLKSEIEEFEEKIKDEEESC